VADHLPRLPALNLHLMFPILRQGIQAADVGTQKNLSPEGDIHRMGQVPEHLLRQGLQSELQIMDIVDVAVGVDLPPSDGGGKGHGGTVRGFAVGGDGGVEQDPVIQIIDASDGLRHPAHPSGGRIYQQPPGAGPCNQGIAVVHQEIPLGLEAAHSPRPGLYGQPGPPGGTLQQLQPPRRQHPEYPSPGYVIDATSQIQTVTVNPADTQTITFYNEPLCSLTLSKKDSVSGKPVPGTEFTVRDSSGAIIGKYTTGSDGTVTVTGLIPGSTVVVTETKVPKGYVLNPTPQTIVVKNGTGNSWVSGGTVSSGTNSSGGSFGSSNNSGTPGGTVSGGGTSGGNNLDFENDPTTILTIQKFVDGTNNEPMKGVEFLVTDGTGAVVGPNNGYYTTDKDGRITIPNLEPGMTITARETKTLEGFLLDPTPQTITIKVGEGQHLTFWNKKAGGLIVNKVDAETKKPLAGVKFKITYADGSNVDMDGGKVSSNGLYTTDTNGQIKILGITGTVTVEEIETLPGYVIDPNAKSQTVVINANDTQTLTFTNSCTGGVELIKVDASDKTKRLPGVTFEIRKANDALVDTVTTDKNGRVALDLDAGSYYAVEIEAAEGYKLDDTPTPFTVEDGKPTKITITNKKFIF